MKIIKSFVRFIRYNDYKSVSILCWIYSALYRFQVLHMDTKKMQVKWGIEGEESDEDETMEHYKYAKAVSICVNHVCNKTVWACGIRAISRYRRRDAAIS